MTFKIVFNGESTAMGSGLWTSKMSVALGLLWAKVAAAWSSITNPRAVLRRMALGLS